MATVPEMEPLKRQRILICVKMPKPVPTKAFLQPVKAATMCTAPHAETRPPTPIPPFLLAQTYRVSSKRIAPTVASYPGHVGGGKSGLVSTVCACAKNPMISSGIVYHRLRTVNLYHIAPKHVCLELIQRIAGKR